MAKNPRLCVSLEPDRHELLLFIAEKNGTSASALIRELVEMAVPTFEHVAGLWKAIEQADGEMRQQILEVSNRAHTNIGHFLAEAMGQANLFQDEVDAIIAGCEAPARAPGDDGEPPYCNTGVRSTLQVQNKPEQAA